MQLRSSARRALTAARQLVVGSGRSSPVQGLRSVGTLPLGVRLAHGPSEPPATPRAVPSSSQHWAQTWSQAGDKYVSWLDQQGSQIHLQTSDFGGHAKCLWSEARGLLLGMGHLLGPWLPGRSRPCSPVDIRGGLGRWTDAAWSPNSVPLRGHFSRVTWSWENTGPMRKAAQPRVPSPLRKVRQLHR